jgi:hypothetical protein
VAVQGPGHLICGITSPSPVPAVVLSALTVHSAPSSNSCALGTLEAGVEVQVVERRGDWLRLQSYTLPPAPGLEGLSGARGGVGLAAYASLDALGDSPFDDAVRQVRNGAVMWGRVSDRGVDPVAPSTQLGLLCFGPWLAVPFLERQPPPPAWPRLLSLHRGVNGDVAASLIAHNAPP